MGQRARTALLLEIAMPLKNTAPKGTQATPEPRPEKIRPGEHLPKENLLEVQDLSVAFKRKIQNARGQIITEEARAVDSISFQLNAGETLCLVGESGCGKSMTSLAVLGLVPEPGQITEGKVIFMGQDLRALAPRELQKIRGNTLSMIFQEPMTALNPVLTIGSQIEEVLLTHRKMNRQEAKEEAVRLLGKVGIPAPWQRYNDYPHQMSGGMRQRIVIAMAIANSPKLLIADEPTTALDATIQRQILDLIKELSTASGTATLLITHDLGVVCETADHVVVMYAGRIVEQGSAEQLFANPLHPYTKGLLACSPHLADRQRLPAENNPELFWGNKNRPCTEPCPDSEARHISSELRTRLAVIPGTVPSLWQLPRGCPFNTRCACAFDACFASLPPLQKIERNISATIAATAFCLGGKAAVRSEASSCSKPATRSGGEIAHQVRCWLYLNK